MNSPSLNEALEAINSELAMLSRVKESIEKYLGVGLHGDQSPRAEKLDPVKPVKSVSRAKPDRKPRAAPPIEGDRVCKKCGVPKPLEDFQKSKECVGGRQGTCKKCRSEQSKEWLAKRKSAPAPDATPKKGYPCTRPSCMVLAASPEALERHMFRAHKSN